jgi:hypothetical protein
MNRSEILDTAKQYCMVDRAATHGDAEDSFGLIATYWSAHLDTNVTAADVATMMVLFKLARVKNNPKHIDNFVDAAAYAALSGEISTGGA